mmetsp:Transcript_34234/g.53403  ORF Transcript_34234/g.53403 Transcript_34234/m.53403 type:complete len:96 (-) Transcript_34234:715-1002(-)
MNIFRDIRSQDNSNPKPYNTCINPGTTDPNPKLDSLKLEPPISLAKPDTGEAANSNIPIMSALALAPCVFLAVREHQFCAIASHVVQPDRASANF